MLRFWMLLILVELTAGWKWMAKIKAAGRKHGLMQGRGLVFLVASKITILGCSGYRLQGITGTTRVSWLYGHG